jgi:hypothetical protein
LADAGLEKQRSALIINLPTAAWTGKEAMKMRITSRLGHGNWHFQDIVYWLPDYQA